MPLKKEDITELALRYIEQDEITDFPGEGDIFCILEREIPADRQLEEDEGWGFAGYSICRGYEHDRGSKPEGKWLFMDIVSLATFPPHRNQLRLQPPHIAKGRFQSPGRDREFRILRIDPDTSTESAKQPPKPREPEKADKGHEKEPPSKEQAPSNVLRFPSRKKRPSRPPDPPRRG